MEILPVKMVIFMSCVNIFFHKRVGFLLLWIAREDWIMFVKEKKYEYFAQIHKLF